MPQQSRAGAATLFGVEPDVLLTVEHLVTRTEADARHRQILEELVAIDERQGWRRARARLFTLLSSPCTLRLSGSPLTLTPESSESMIFSSNDSAQQAAAAADAAIMDIDMSLAPVPVGGGMGSHAVRPPAAAGYAPQQHGGYAPQQQGCYSSQLQQQQQLAARMAAGAGGGGVIPNVRQ